MASPIVPPPCSNIRPPAAEGAGHSLVTGGARGFFGNPWRARRAAGRVAAMHSPGQQLPRVLGYVTATAIVVGCVIGSGVFKKASAVAKDVPESGVALLAWVVV